MTHDEIVETLRAEALDERETGWLSDMGQFELYWDESNKSIEIVGAGNGSIDVGQLAGILYELIHPKEER